jgi:hypothetical protein
VKIECQYNQAMYEIAEEFHSPESMIEHFGLAMLTRIVSAGFITLEDADEDKHPSSPFNHRWDAEDVLVFTDDGWAKYRQIFDGEKVYAA